MTNELAWRCPSCSGELNACDRGMVCRSCGLVAERTRDVLEFMPHFKPPGFPAERLSHLADLEERHFWFPARRQLLSRMLRSLPAASPRRAIELGCGLGAHLSLLGNAATTVVGVDAYRAALEAACRRSPNAILVQSDIGRVPLADGQFEILLAADVLEHVESGRFLAEVSRLAAPDARLLLTVPAMPGLWSRADEVAGHRRRFRLRDLRAELAAGGWRIERWTHYQFLLLPLLMVSRRSRIGTLYRLERRPPSWLNALLGAVCRFEVRALGGISLPWGSSLAAVARRAA